MLEGLNEQQLKAVTTTEGPVMVMAGAGSGKTRVLTERIAYIIDQGISPFQILAVTFTNKAADEMKERVEQLVDVETKYMWISTFHSFCSKILRMEIDVLPPYKKDYLVIDDDDSLRIIRNICKELNIDIDEVKPIKFQKLISKIKNVPNYQIKPTDIDITYFNQVNNKYNQYLRDNNILDFDDILVQTLELFKKNAATLEKYQEKFQYIFVDEFQDTNDLQYDLIYMLSSRHKNIFVVGDDFQSIYSFRGAKIENINRFQEDFKGKYKLILLEENYRSTTPILNLANEIIKHNPNQIQKTIFTQKTKGKTPVYYEAANYQSEARFVADKIKKFHLEGDNYNDCLVLYRASEISRTFEDVLIKYQIPYKVYNGFSFYSRKEIKDIISYLRIIVHPTDDFSFQRIINEPKRKIGPVLLEKLQVHASKEKMSLFNSISTFNGKGAGNLALHDFYKMINSIKEKINDIKLFNLIDIILEESGYKVMLFAQDSNNFRLDNIYELKSKLKEIEVKSDGDNLKKLEDLLNDLSLRTDDESKENQDAVLLATYHQVKGLEKKNVFMVAMEEGVFPSKYHKDDLDIEEERRICYVGITRAKERLYVTNAKSRMLYGHMEHLSPSRFIKEMGNEYLKNASNALWKNAKEKYESYLSIKSTIQSKSNLEEDYHCGDKVEHESFGVGIIVSVGTDDYITIAFPVPYGIKSLSKNHPSYKKLEKK